MNKQAKKIKTINADQIIDIINSQEYGAEQYSSYGLRAMMRNPITGAYPDVSIGDSVDNSYVWDDNDPTNYMLNGVCAVELDLNDIDKAITQIKAYTWACKQIVL